MDFGKVLQRAMVDKEGVNSAAALGRATGVSKHITRRLLNSDGRCSLNDLKATADFLNVDIKFIINGEES